MDETVRSLGNDGESYRRLIERKRAEPRTAAPRLAAKAAEATS